ncbi:hypothetical protein [Neobacillus dielmonensis]|uniref:hypothetical protein n=1 Tax=Neobacillus dielmonensis TaxID=1347369 RepID=UPI0005A800B5|nr:hypothetical protein [Neobacillus dielmonensis]
MIAVLNKIAKGITVCYAEVFPDRDNNYLHLAYMGKLFLIADSYCMNPECTCQESALNFVQVYPREDKKADSFMIGVKLNGRGFRIHEQGGFHKREIQSIYLHFTADTSNLNLLNDRFAEMREKAKEMLR